MAKNSMYAIDRSEEYLAHYGIKGMKWGVRKAIEAGGTGLGNRKLARQYKKAQKKLAKLEKRANNGAKYARRAAALGAGAAAAGGLAALGTGGVGSAIRGGSMALRKGGSAVGQGLENLGRGMIKRNIRGAGLVRKAGMGVSKLSSNAARAGVHAGTGIEQWGRKSAFNTGVKTKDILNAANTAGNKLGGSAAAVNRAMKTGVKTKDIVDATHAATKSAGIKAAQANRAINTVSNNTIARAGAAALGLGLAGAAGYNAYRAATTKRAAKKAAEFKAEMNRTFAGTAYGKQNGGSNGNKKRRRR